jgi:hypothetical protein
MTRRMLEPWSSYDTIFNLTPLGREFRQCLKVLHDFTDQVHESHEVLELTFYLIFLLIR